MPTANSVPTTAPTTAKLFSDRSVLRNEGTREVNKPVTANPENMNAAADMNAWRSFGPEGTAGRRTTMTRPLTFVTVSVTVQRATAPENNATR